MLKEFKDFINKGNVMDLAVGVIIGAAFGKIVSSFIDDLINPILGLLMGGVDLTNNFAVLKGAGAATLEEAKKNGAVLAWGSFLNGVIQFIVTAFVIFLMVKLYNKSRKPAEAAPAETPADVVLLGEIRDLLKK
jgi:large conductance mechanosensitive channel